MTEPYLGSSEINKGCPLPPYNTLNFTAEGNSTIFSTLAGYAQTQVNYPLPTGSNPDQIRSLQQNLTVFNGLNQRAIAIKTLNQSLGPAGQVPYPTFRSEAERLMYRQGQATTSARNQLTGPRPSNPCSTLYDIIQS